FGTDKKYGVAQIYDHSDKIKVGIFKELIVNLNEIFK
ncbi:unnamed protein product, partial [marine sediment metagenome]